MKNIVLIIFALMSFTGCTTTTSIKTNPKSIWVNNPKDVENCKYIGIVQTKHKDEWQWALREKAANKGGTHVYTTGPNGVTRDPEGETINANVYLCEDNKKS